MADLLYLRAGKDRKPRHSHILGSQISAAFLHFGIRDAILSPGFKGDTARSAILEDDRLLGGFL